MTEQSLPQTKVRGPATVFDPANYCIYCGALGDLRREHIIPYGLGGNLIFPRASCQRCETITGRFEQSCLKGILADFRVRHGFPTRRKKERKTFISQEINVNGQQRIQNMPISEYPRAVILMKMEEPGILIGRPPSREFKANPLIVVHSKDQKKFFSKNWNFGKYRHADFCRMIAKIAHSYAMATQPKETLAGYELLLPEFILEDKDYCSYLIGSDASRPPIEKSMLHKIELHYVDVGSASYAIARIHLFAFMGVPAYLAVVGRKARALQDTPEDHL